MDNFFSWFDANEKVKVGIVGYGFVGKATAKGFSKNTELF